MILDSKTANEMHAAIEQMFRRLPAQYQTDEIKSEIAKAVAQSGHGTALKDYDAAARGVILKVFAGMDSALANSRRLAEYSQDGGKARKN